MANKNQNKTKEEWKLANLKKIKYMQSLGIKVSAAGWTAPNDYDDQWHWQEIEDSNDTPEQLIDIISDDYNKNTYRLNFFVAYQDNICIFVSPLTKALLGDIQTLFLQINKDGAGYYVFKYDSYWAELLNNLFEYGTDNADWDICNNQLRYDNIDVYCWKSGLPKIKQPKGREYTLDTVPYMSFSQFKIIEKAYYKLKECKEYQPQLNQGTKYRLPKVISEDLAQPYLTVNDRKVLEKLLLTITNSTFVLTFDTQTPFIIPIKDFTKGLKLSRRNETKIKVLAKSCNNLIYYGMVSAGKIDTETGMFSFEAPVLCEKIKQQNNQREIGFYDNLPKTKQSNVVATWLDYLYMILNFKQEHKTLLTSLDSLLARLGLNHLLHQHRLSEIAKTLNTLLKVSNERGYTTGECIFTSAIVKELLNDRQGLKKYIHLIDIQKDCKNKNVVEDHKGEN